MKVRVKIDPRQAMRAGVNASGYTVIDLDPALLTESERAVLADSPTYGGSGGPAADLYPDYAVASPTIEEVRHALAGELADRARKAEERRQIEQAVLARLDRATADPDPWEIPSNSANIYARDGSAYIDKAQLPAEAHERFDSLYARLRARRAHEEEQQRQERLQRCTAVIERLEKDPSPLLANGQWDSGLIPDGEGMYGGGLNVPNELKPRLAALRAREEARIRAEADAREAGKKKVREEWVMEHGTESQRERLAAGLLANEEIDASIEEWLFRPLADQTRYERITSSDLVAESDDDDCTTDAGGGFDEHDISCSTTPAESVDPETWERAKALRAILPAGAASVIRLHHCWCDRKSCQATADRYGLMVSLTHGPLTFRREFAL